MTDDELLAQVLRRFLERMAVAPAARPRPVIIIGENELLIDGRVWLTDDEVAAVLRVRDGEEDATHA